MTISREQLRRDVIEGGLDLQLRLATAPWPPFSHLHSAATAWRTAQEVREFADSIMCSPSGEHAEHKELVKALRTAEEAASIAFDAAINAAWQLMWVMDECKCPACAIGHQRENARNQ